MRGFAYSGAEWLTERLCAAYQSGELQQPEPAPPPIAVPLSPCFNALPELYENSRSLCLAEALAMVRDGLRASSQHAPVRLKLVSLQRAAERKSARLGALCFRLASSSAPDDLRAGGVFLLSSRGHESVLAVVDGREHLRFEVLDTALYRAGFESAHAFAMGAEWTGRCVASVLLQQRCIDTCIKRPKPPFMRALLGYKAATHIRFGEEEEEEAGEEEEEEEEEAEAEAETALSETLPDAKRARLGTAGQLLMVKGTRAR